MEDWQKAIFYNLMGWKKADGYRRYREALVYVPRKNSKTTMAAALVLLVLFTDGEPGAEIYSAAAEREQARLCFEITQGMIRQSKEMVGQCQLFKYSTVRGMSSYKAISAEAGSKHGYNAHLLVNDELHAQRTPDLTEALMTGMGSRRQPLVVHLTTADYEREGSICNTKHDYAHKVMSGVIEDSSFLPVVYEATRDDDWTSEETWKKANPNYGISVSKEYIARECKRAQDSPAYENTFKRLLLNIRTEQAERWLQLEKWDACDVLRMPAMRRLHEDSLRGRRCYGGLDLSTTTDLSCLALVFPDDNGESFGVLLKTWVPNDGARVREKRDQVPYMQWIREGWIVATPGEVVDYGFLRYAIVEAAELYDMQEIAYDPWNATQLCQQLTDEDRLPMIEHRQGMVSMAAPTKEFERLVIGGHLRHGGNPVLRWAASNVVVESDAAGNYKPTKKKSTERIDPVVATIMAVGRAVLGGEGEVDVYGDGHELLVV